MSGVLYFDDPKPVAGAKLIIIVDSVNKPTGIWSGELLAVENNDYAVGQHPYYLRDTRWASCGTRITDPQAPQEFMGYEPQINYVAYIATSSGHYFCQRLKEANTEIRGLKRRMEIEKGVWISMIKAVADPNSVPRFEKLIDEFLAKFNRVEALIDRMNH